jgi:4-hydroxy-2-oxoheptanedioate aldolase
MSAATMHTLSTNRFKQALAAGEVQLGLWSTLPDPYVSEIVGGAGYDWVLLDSEHTPTDVPNLLRQLQGVASARIAHGTLAPSAVVRPAWNDPVLIKRTLDIGAQTLLLPFVQNADEARAAVSAVRYAPRGLRGVGGSTRASAFGRIGDYAKAADRELCLLVQLETGAALDALEEIAMVEGVDGVFIGPADLAANLGHPGEPDHPEVRRRIDAAIVQLRRLGKPSGILATDEMRARELVALGAQFVAVAVDLVVLARGLEAIAQRLLSLKQPRTPSAGPETEPFDSTAR